MALVRFSTADSESTKARAMAFGQVLQDFPLARGQPTNRRVRQAGRRASSSSTIRGSMTRASRRYLFEGAQQLVEIADPVFEQVSQSVRAVL